MTELQTVWGYYVHAHRWDTDRLSLLLLPVVLQLGHGSLGIRRWTLVRATVVLDPGSRRSPHIAFSSVRPYFLCFVIFSGFTLWWGISLSCWCFVHPSVTDFCWFGTDLVLSNVGLARYSMCVEEQANVDKFRPSIPSVIAVTRSTPPYPGSWACRSCICIVSVSEVDKHSSECSSYTDLASRTRVYSIFS